jgi:hypothetical protein
MLIEIEYLNLQFLLLRDNYQIAHWMWYKVHCEAAIIYYSKGAQSKSQNSISIIDKLYLASLAVGRLPITTLPIGNFYLIGRNKCLFDLYKIYELSFLRFDNAVSFDYKFS